MVVYGVITQRLNNLSDQDYTTLTQLCKLARILYNQAIDNIKQHFIQTKRYLRYEDNYPLLKDSQAYKLLNASVAQQVIRKAHINFEGFLTRLKRSKKKDLQKIIATHNFVKNELFPLPIIKFSIKNDTFTVPLSREGKNHFSKVTIRIPKIIKNLDIIEILIVPIANGRWFEAHYVYKTEQTKVINNDIRKALGVKLGLDDLALCVDTEGNTFTIDGKKLVSVIRRYTNEYRRLKSIYEKQNITTETKKIATLRAKRKILVRDYLHKAAKTIINYCIENNISNVVVGVMSRDFLLKTYYDKENNQNISLFVPFKYFRNLVKHKCQKFGIQYIEVIEDEFIYKASALDKDPLPNQSNNIEVHFSGNQLDNGLYLTANNDVIDVNINACLNILRRAGFELDFDYKTISEKIKNQKKIYIWPQ